MTERDYGCCIAYGAAGTGLVHKVQYTAADDGININLYLAGTTSFDAPDGTRTTLKVETNYPYSGAVAITVASDAESEYSLYLRIPEWSTDTQVAVNGAVIDGVRAGEYLELRREWKSGDRIVLDFDMYASLYYGSAECSNPDAQYNVAVLYGPLVLARDARLDEDIYQTVKFKTDADGHVAIRPSYTASFPTLCEFEAELEDGSVIHLVDYASAGKTYTEESLMSVFLPTTDYWKSTVDFADGVIIECVDDTAIMTVTDGKLGMGAFRSDYELSDELDINDNKIRFVDRGNGKYSMHFAAAGDNSLCIGVGDDGMYMYVEEYTGAPEQLYELKRAGLYYYKIVAFNGALISETGDGQNVHLYSEANSAKQKWLIYA